MVISEALTKQVRRKDKARRALRGTAGKMSYRQKPEEPEPFKILETTSSAIFFFFSGGGGDTGK
jgi:hypothetical protein